MLGVGGVLVPRCPVIAGLLELVTAPFSSRPLGDVCTATEGLVVVEEGKQWEPG